MDRNSTIELVSIDDEPKIAKGNGPRGCSSLTCLVVSVSIFISSFFPLLIMVPISRQIEDKAAVSAPLLRLNSSSNVLLATVDALWHWEVIASTTDLTASESITLFIIPEDKTNEVWVNYTMLGDYIVYGLSGSVISSEGQFTVVSGLEDTCLCASCYVYHVIENSYYQVQNSSATVHYNLRYVSNSVNDNVMCELEGTSDDNDPHCRLSFDKIKPYNVIANLHSTEDMKEPITVQLSENGRRTWYILFVLLALPIIFSAIALAITVICIRANPC